MSEFELYIDNEVAYKIRVMADCECEDLNPLFKADECKKINNGTTNKKDIS